MLQITERHKYAKFKTADIRKAIKEGRQPTPGPPGADPVCSSKLKATKISFHSVLLNVDIKSRYWCDRGTK